MAHPAAAVLDADEVHAGEAREHPVADRRRERVLDRAAVVGDGGERLRPEGDELARRCPPTCSGTAGSRCRTRAGPRAGRPPGCGPRTGRTPGGTATRVPRSPLTGAGRRSTARAPRSMSRSSSAMPSSSTHGFTMRRGEDATLVVVAPLVVQPLVERPDRDLGEVRVVEQPLLDEAGERREHEARVDALLVEQLEPRARGCGTRGCTASARRSARAASSPRRCAPA